MEHYIKSIANNETFWQMSRQGSDLGPGGLGGSEGGSGGLSGLRKRALTHSSSGISFPLLLFLLLFPPGPPLFSLIVISIVNLCPLWLRLLSAFTFTPTFTFLFGFHFLILSEPSSCLFPLWLDLLSPFTLLFDFHFLTSLSLSYPQ